MTVIEEIKSVLALASITGDLDADLTLRERLSEAEELVREFAPYTWCYRWTTSRDLVKRLNLVRAAIERTGKAGILSPQAQAAMMIAGGCIRSALGIVAFQKTENTETLDSF